MGNMVYLKGGERGIIIKKFDCSILVRTDRSN